MKWLTFGLGTAAMLFFAIQNNVFDKFTRKYDTWSVMLMIEACILAILLPVCLIKARLSPHPLSLAEAPPAVLIAIAFAALMFLCGNFCYISTYAIGGDMRLITVSPVMLPVLSSLIRAFSDPGKTPLQYWAGLAIIGIGLVAVATSIPTAGTSPE